MCLFFMVFMTMKKSKLKKIEIAAGEWEKITQVNISRALHYKENGF